MAAGDPTIDRLNAMFRKQLEADMRRIQERAYGVPPLVPEPVATDPLADLRRSMDLLCGKPPLPFSDLTIVHPDDWPAMRDGLEKLPGIVVLEYPDDDHKFCILDGDDRHRVWLVEAATPGKIMTFKQPADPFKYQARGISQDEQAE